VATVGFALSRWFDGREQPAITIVSQETPEEMFGDAALGNTLSAAMQSRGIEFVSDFSVERIKPNSVIAADGRAMNCDLVMVIPPFSGPGAVLHTRIVDAEGYILVEKTMRVPGVERMYAAGDSVSLPGPKMGHMAVRQAELAAENLVAEIQGRALSAVYEHEAMMVVETDGSDSIFFHKDLWTDVPPNLKQGRFWAWAKHGHQQYWMRRHA
jgi:sulfide:quinone oxidoreductase